MEKKIGRPQTGSHIEDPAEREQFIRENLNSVKLIFRCTPEEIENLDKKILEINSVRKINRTQYIKEKIFEKHEKSNNYAIKLNLIKEINKIGINVNQSVKKINSYQYIDHQNYLNIQKHLKELTEKLLEITQIIENI